MASRAAPGFAPVVESGEHGDRVLRVDGIAGLPAMVVSRSAIAASMSAFSRCARVGGVLRVVGAARGCRAGRPEVVNTDRPSFPKVCSFQLPLTDHIGQLA